MNKNDKIYMDEQAYKEYEDSLRELKKQIEKVRFEKGSEASAALSDSWHDNFAFEHAKNMEMMLTKRYYELMKDFSRIEILKNGSSDSIGVGSSFSLLFEGDYTEDPVTFRLVSSIKKIGANDVTVNSPLGRSVLGKKTGDSIEYKVNNNVVRAKITSIN